jgi:uncharacterized protein YndB with AHSA1/START domain
MKPVELSVVINRPIEACFAYLTDLANDLEWRREWIDAEKSTDGRHGVGARYRLTGALLGRRIATEYEAIAIRVRWRMCTPTPVRSTPCPSGGVTSRRRRVVRSRECGVGRRDKKGAIDRDA